MGRRVAASRWLLLPALPALALLLLFVLANLPFRSDAASAAAGGYDCSSAAAYVGWNPYRRRRDVRHNFVAIFPLQVPVALPPGGVPFRYAVLFQGRPVDVEPAALDNSRGGAEPIGGFFQSALVVPIRTRWVLRIGFFDRRQWELRWRCLSSQTGAPGQR